jgi:hypothetical protein
MQEVTQLITAITALAAVIVSPLIALYVSRLQFRGSVISNNRQQWINTLRDTIAQFLAKQQATRSRFDAKTLPHAEFLEHYEKAARLAYKIYLLLNPKESDHAELATCIARMLGSVDRSSDPSFDFNAALGQVLDLSQEILKREWTRVKRGD